MVPFGAGIQCDVGGRGHHHEHQRNRHANPRRLIDYLDASHPGQVVELTFYSSAASGVVTKSVTLESAETYSHQSSDANKGFLGVESAFLTPTQLKGTYVAPWNGPGGPISGAFDWVVLPLAGLQPMQGPAENSFISRGPSAE